VARITPDGYTKIHFLTTIATLAEPSPTEISNGKELTPFLTPAGLDTPETSTDADTSSIASARDFSVPATIGGEVTGEFYRDDGTGSTTDVAWTALPRLTTGFLVIARYGGSGANNAIAVGDTVEVWQVRISERSNARVTRGEALRFSSKFAVSADPIFNAVVTV
jgi:hypothetical protein